MGRNGPPAALVEGANRGRRHHEGAVKATRGLEVEVFDGGVEVEPGVPLETLVAALFPVGLLPFEEPFDERGRVRSGLAAPGDEPRRCPFRIGAVGCRDVRGFGRVSAFPADPEVCGDPAVLVEDLDRRGAETDIDLAAGQRVGDAVEGVFDLDVVVDVDAGLAPLGVLVALGRERLERRPVQVLEPAAAAAFGLREHPDVRDRLGRQRPAPGHVHEGVVRGAEDPDEDHGVPHRAGLPVHDLELRARVVDERLLARPVDLPHDHVEAPPPRLVAVAEPAVLIAVPKDRTVFQPQQPQRHALVAPKLPVDMRPVRLRPGHPRWRQGREQRRFQRNVVQSLRQQSRETGRRRPAYVVAHRAVGNAERRANLPVAAPELVLQAHQFWNLPHGQPPLRHPLRPRRGDHGEDGRRRRYGRFSSAPTRSLQGDRHVGIQDRQGPESVIGLNRNH